MLAQLIIVSRSPQLRGCRGSGGHRPVRVTRAARIPHRGECRGLFHTAIPIPLSCPIRGGGEGGEIRCLIVRCERGKDPRPKNGARAPDWGILVGRSARGQPARGGRGPRRRRRRAAVAAWPSRRSCSDGVGAAPSAAAPHRIDGADRAARPPTGGPSIVLCAPGLYVGRRRPMLSVL